jgi:hypothetical protein
VPGRVARFLDRLLPPLPAGAADFARRMRSYFAVTWLPLMALMALSTFRDPARRFPFLLGQLGVYALVYVLAARSRGRMLEGQGAGVRRLAMGLFAGLLVAYVGLCVLLYGNPAWLPIDLNNGLAPVVSLCALLAVLAGLAGAVWYYGRRWATVAFAVIAAWLFVCNCFPYKLRFVNVDYGDRLALRDAEEPQAPPTGADELTAPPLAESERRAECDRLARGCARLDARLFPASQPGHLPAPYAGQSYEKLFPRYRKLQLILVFVGLHRQLYADNVRGRDPIALDRLTYAELFQRYRSTFRHARAVEEQQYLAPWRAGLAPPGRTRQVITPDWR